ncbi:MULTISPECIES: winged helix-turn-helix domain-containing protein [Cellulomonas]|uniref:DNA-binding transcriptional ArsR family regulator n=1 Tax=Cellulomonas iranensis TaxID=76862 RepID=A0ABU0GMH3_9CELL|nr:MULTISPECIES: helix-turn-helix domain-containing protein [Cellulomonas]MDQ0425931.1 DNA-binding transcriptional ArsR family regulator [Cellulomonas iranensis]TFH71828.1 ArsR family transcriptional regulator [Cellulomonas sp. HD19AZ1]
MTDDKTPDERALGPEALKAFAHPLRMAMYAELRNGGPATATMLGRRLGESSGQTSYHLRQLEKHGFVEDDPGHPAGRERWWRAVGFRMDDLDALDDPGSAQAVRAVLQSMIAERAQTLTAWAASLDEVRQDWDVQVFSNVTADLTQDEAAELVERLTAVVEEITERGRVAKEEGRTDGRRRVRLYLDVLPLPEPRGT